MKKYISWALALSIWGMQFSSIMATTITDTVQEEQVISINAEKGEEIPKEQEKDLEEDKNLDAKEALPKEGLHTQESPNEESTPSKGVDKGVSENLDLSGKMMLILDDPSVLMNGQPYVLDVPPAILDGQTYVELRFVAEQLVKTATSWNPVTKETTLSNGEKSITIRPSSNIAIVDGMTIEMPGKVKVEGGRTLVPLRFLSEQFGVIVDFREGGTILLTVETQEPVVNTAPVADFTFEQAIYTAGQAVQVIDSSYDVDGDAIVSKQWMLGNDTTKVATSLHELFKKSKPGIYDVSLKVKDSKGAWSEWTTRTIEVLPNEKPVINSITASQSEYAQGEKITFNFDYSNESWEEITAERWSYRAIHESENKKISKSPEVIFKAGEYLVTLQLQDEYGNLSDVAEKIIKITDEVLMSEMEYKFSEGKPGTMIDNFDRLNYRDYKDATDIMLTKNNNMLVMSDSPERVTDIGILYEETIRDEGRIMIHHVNAFSPEQNTAMKKHVVVAVENTNEEPVTLIMENKVVKGPSTDQLYIGQQLLLDYFRGKPAETYVVQPGEIIYIYESRNIRWGSEECISGMMDFSTSAPLKVRVAAIDTTTLIEELKTMPYLDKDIHPRGTFFTTEISHDVRIDDKEISKITLGDRSTNVEPGLDAITGEVVLNTGNYGISYMVKVTATEQEVAIILNPRGGLFRGAIKWDNGETYMLPDVGFLPGYERAALIGVVKAGETRSFEYILPNGSAAPVIIGFIPENIW